VADDEHAPRAMLYRRDRSLDPRLVWKGTDEQDRAGLRRRDAGRSLVRRNRARSALLVSAFASWYLSRGVALRLGV
jgi:hypothetical protein